MTQDLEEWRPVPGFETYYLVSSFGRVWSLPRITEMISKWGTPTKLHKAGGLLTPSPGGGSKYLGVLLKTKQKNKTLRVNRLVCEVFHGPPPSAKHLALHGDGDKNNNRADNLRWGTQLENCADREKHGTTAKGCMQTNAKLNDDYVRCIRSMLADGIKQRNIAAVFGVSQTAIKYINRGVTWKHVSS